MKSIAVLGTGARGLPVGSGDGRRAGTRAPARPWFTATRSIAIFTMASTTRPPL